jgi:hypothetical protein
MSRGVKMCPTKTALCSDKSFPEATWAGVYNAFRAREE